ncbi:hypothetical protein L1077_23165 [Pseudoalteromonas luteoviolacea]|uniref:hypothetical protein n=1 Tax=Pseudoalteromonas luteoviolacea TaxID=43657 RepID=UPI001F429452|nr:hypothetical protein [Pseudoalteromonas luteoviolacea]MCF6442331.1 hypothetical protein [Pseudoalteromonas luteoviolacea]
MRLFNIISAIMRRVPEAPQYTKRRLNSGYPEVYDNYIGDWVLQKVSKVTPEQYAELPECDNVNEYVIGFDLANTPDRTAVVQPRSAGKTTKHKAMLEGAKL